MPELPEVESIKLQLERFLVGLPRGGSLRGHKIENIEIRNKRYEIGDKEKLSGAKITGVRRFAKVLSIDLSDNKSILIHVKLTGQLIYRGPNLPRQTLLSKKVVGGIPGKHTHVVFHLDKGGVLYYNDIRQFGWVKLVDSQKLMSDGFVGKLGPEPQVVKGYKGQEFLTPKHFGEILAKTKRAVKVVLMDQERMGGVGNIYANDALWLAGIDPRRAANSLQHGEIEKLYNSLLSVLKAGLKYGGASELAFVTPDGNEGKYQEHTLVYGHQGQFCKNPACRQAGAIIKKTFKSGRGTYFCPLCQK